MNLKNIIGSEWVELGSREVSILFISLVITSYKVTFPKIGLEGTGGALGSGVVNYGKGLQFTAYRDKDELTKSTEYFKKLLRKTPGVLSSVYLGLDELVKNTKSEIGRLEIIASRLDNSENKFIEFYQAFKIVFLTFFPTQVLPFSLEQTMLADNKQNMLKQYSEMLVSWRSLVHNLEIRLENLLNVFFEKAVKCFGTDIKYLTDTEFLMYLSNNKKLPVDFESRKIESVVVWNISSNEPCNVITGHDVAAISSKLKTEKMQKIMITDFTGHPAFQGVVEGNAFVIEKKTDFLKIPEGSVVIAKVVEVDDASHLKNIEVVAAITEEGGITTHIAILSRELKIPTIVGVKGIISHVKTGDKMSVDAINGKIKILN